MEPKAALTALHNEFAAGNPAPVHAPEISEGAKSVKVDVAPPSAPAVSDGPQPGDLRLVIEQNGDSGDYIYKTVDRRTGETLNQYPREQILKLREAEAYHSGDVFDGKA
jgi:flagellar protein FlaG